MYSIVNSRKNAKQSTFGCFIDLKKAFDTVNRTCLWFKVKSMGINGKFYDAIYSLYDNISCCLQINGVLTDKFKISKGVKQGCIISPTLFAVFINDLATDLRALNTGIDIDGVIINMFMYADDRVLLSETETGMQKMFDVVASWCEKWRLLINIEKTCVLHFRPQNRPRSKYVFQIGTDVIDYLDKYRYLGIWFTEHLDLAYTARELSKAANRALGVVTTKFLQSGGMDYRVFQKLYESLVEPILMYCAGI